MRSTATGVQMLRYANEDNFERMLLTGCAGSGKTTVAIYRLIRLIRQQRYVKLFTYHKMLVYAIREILSNEELERADRYGDTFLQWVYRVAQIRHDPQNPLPIGSVISQLDDALNERGQMEEYIIDEGQDLWRLVYESLPNHCRRFFVTADDAQQVHEDRATVNEIRAELQHHQPFVERHLDRNFRNTYEIYRFARQFQPRENEVVWDENMLAFLERDENRRGEKPLVLGYRNNEERNTHLLTQLRNAIRRGGSIAVLCPLGSNNPKCHQGESVQGMYDFLTGNRINASFYYSKNGDSNENVPNDLGDVLVTTFMSSKGLEFDEVYIPRYNFWKTISNEWYVACTRARRRLVVYRDMTDPQIDPIAQFDHGTYTTQKNQQTPGRQTDDLF